MERGRGGCVECEQVNCKHMSDLGGSQGQHCHICGCAEPEAFSGTLKHTSTYHWIGQSHISITVNPSKMGQSSKRVCQVVSKGVSLERAFSV